MAIRLRSGDVIACGITRTADHILDHHRRSERSGQLVPENAGKNISSGAGGKTAQEPNGTRRVSLGFDTVRERQ